MPRRLAGALPHSSSIAPTAPLGRFRRAEATPLLRRAVEEPPTRRAAALGLGLSDDAASHDMLAQAATDTDSKAACAALAELGAVGDPAVGRLVLPGLAATHPAVRWTALKVAQRLGCLFPGVAESLAAGDPDPDVRAVAATILREAGRTRSLEVERWPDFCHIRVRRVFRAA